MYNTKFSIQLLQQVTIETANSYLNYNLIPKLSIVLGVNSCDITVKSPFKKAFQKKKKKKKFKDTLHSVYFGLTASSLGAHIETHRKLILRTFGCFGNKFEAFL